MADKDKNKPRRILDVDVNEVSLVDRAANLRRFLVIKRLTKEETMPAFEMDENVVAEEFEGIYTELQDVEKALPDDAFDSLEDSEIEEIQKALPEDLASALKETIAWMKRMGKMKGAPTGSINRVLTFLGKVAGGKYPYPKPAAKSEDVEKGLPSDIATSARRVVAFLEKAIEEFPNLKPVKKSEDDEVEQFEIEKALPADLAAAIRRVVSFLGKVLGGKYPYPKPAAKADEGVTSTEKTEKSEGGDTETPAVQIMADGTVIVGGQAVQKGKKFTQGRIGTLKDMTMQLLKLIGEVGDEETMKAMGEAMKGFSSYTQGVQGVAPAQKAAEPEKDEEKEELKKQLAEVTKQLGEVTKRLETVENARAASTSVDGQGGTDKERVEKDFWKGVLDTR